jgi:ABC-type branched-subunit amino acid transport system substrate-binding protein
MNHVSVRERPRRRWRIALLAAVVPVALAACSSSGSKPPPSNDSGSGVTSSTGSADSIKLGMIVPYDNASLDESDAITAARAGIRGINSAGGIGGHSVSLDVCNEDANSNDALSCARQMVSDHVVATVFTLSVSGSGGQIASILAAAGIPQIGPAALTPPEFVAPNNYVVSGGPPYEYSCAAALGFQKYGLKKIAIASVAGLQDSTVAAVKATASKLGVQVVASVPMPSNAADFAPFAATIQSSGAQAVSVPALPVQFDQLLRSLRGVGDNAVFESNTGTPDPGDYAKLGPAVQGTLVCGPFPPASALSKFPGLAKMKADLDAENAAGDNGATWGPTLKGTDEWAWWDTQAFYELAKSLPTVNAASVTNALKTASNLTVDGLIPPWTPSNKGPAGYTQVSSPYEYEMAVDNSQTELLSPTPIDASKLFSS